MMRALVFGVFTLCCATAMAAAAAFDRSHAAWTGLLGRHVQWDRDGSATRVDYAGFAVDAAQLSAYLKALSGVRGSEFRGWSKDDREAFLINAYNAATVELVLTRYPELESIKDLGGLFPRPGKRGSSTCSANDAASMTSNMISCAAPRIIPIRASTSRSTAHRSAVLRFAPKPMPGPRCASSSGTRPADSCATAHATVSTPIAANWKSRGYSTGTGRISKRTRAAFAHFWPTVPRTSDSMPGAPCNCAVARCRSSLASTIGA